MARQITRALNRASICRIVVVQQRELYLIRTCSLTSNAERTVSLNATLPPYVEGRQEEEGQARKEGERGCSDQTGHDAARRLRAAGSTAPHRGPREGHGHYGPPR